MSLTKLMLKFKYRKEAKNEMESEWLRTYFKEHHDISVGLYSYGCFDTERFSRGMTIGRYCSFSRTCVFLNGNHGLSFLSLHPYLYNKSLGLVESETINRTKFEVADDVWVGHNAIILPSVSKIGRGAVVAAGAVVTTDVNPYEIVAGVPAKVIRKRFEENILKKIEESHWWKWEKDKLANEIKTNPNFIYNPSQFLDDIK